MAKHILSLVFFYWFSLNSYSQNHQYRQYTTDDGLPTNYVYGVVEDDEGYIWAYTEKGIAKFDGERFQVFTTADGLPSNDVYQMAKDDSTGLLWLLSTAHTPAYIEKDSVAAFYELKDKSAYFSKYQGRIKYVFGNDHYFVRGKALILDSLMSLEKNDFLLAKNHGQKEFSILYRKNEQLYGLIGDSPYSSAFKVNLDEATFQEIPFSTKTNGLNTNNQCRGIFEMAFPFYMEGSTTDLYFFNFENKTTQIFDRQKFSDEPIRYCSFDFPNDTTLIVHSDKYFLFFDKKLQLKQVFSPENIANQYTLLRFFEDSRGNYWIGTREGGLFFISKEALKTSHIQTENGRDQVIEKLLWNRGKIFAVNDNFNIYQLTAKNELQIFYEHPQQPLFNDAIVRPNGDMLFVGGIQPLVFLNQQQKPINSSADYPALKGLMEKPFFKDYTYINAKQISLNEKHQQLFYYCQFGLFKYDMQQAKVELIGDIRHDWEIHTDTFTHITYFANQEGIYSFKEGQLVQELATQGTVTLLWAKDAQTLWLGTQNNGLLAWNRTTNELQQISQQKNILVVCRDANRYLLGTPQGVVVLIEKDGVYQEDYCYDKKDGLLTDEILDVIADSQFIYAATIKGIMKIKKVFPPLAVEDTLSRLNIQTVAINDSIFSKANLSQLKHNQNKVKISYHLLDFASEGHVQYEYKLNPIQQDWVTTDAKEVRFEDLQPQDYTFDLKATDWYGREYFLKAPLTFCIQKAFWQTWWFRGAILALFLSTIAVLVKRREYLLNQKIAREKALNNRIADLQLQSLRGQMNPHFIFNALGSIQYFIQTHRTDEADNYLTMFARLMRKYLDSATERSIDLATELEMLKEYTDLEMMRFEGLFATEIELDATIDAEEEIIPSMMLQPFVENAINHGLQLRKVAGGLLMMECKRNLKGALVFTITDNGIGRINAAKYRKKSHISRGMQNVMQRIVTLRANEITDISIQIDDLNPKDKIYPGTKVTLTFQNMNYGDI